MGKHENLTGKKYGKLTVVSEYEPLIKPSGKPIIRWECICECGNKTIVYGEKLRSGRTKSCGCLRTKQMAITATRHGKSDSRLNKIYLGIKQRCYNQREQAYKNYGGRGITMCEEWRNSFEAFYEWAIANGYSDDLTIDRINVNGNYEPSNCRWATKKEQANNTRRNKNITYNGITHTLSEWANILNINYYTLYERIYVYGWSVEKAFNTN